MSISAMKQALEALALVASSDEWQGCPTYEGQIATEAYESLRQAIEQAEKQENRLCREIYEVWAGSEGIPVPQTCAEGYLLQLIEEMRDIAKQGLRVHASDMSEKHVHESDKHRHEFEEMVKKGTKAWADTPDDWVDELRGGAEKQEPVAWMKEWEDGHRSIWLYKPTMFYESELQPLYLAPQKEWVGFCGVRELKNE